MRFLLAAIAALFLAAPAAGEEPSAAPPRRANRLAQEKSPYLLQHAHNPVDWYPWAPEAFEKAKAENKPIFLSIGYSTCHWCHVMERESFENEEIAAYLNEHFVSIKVDREERPDVDAVYMQAVQATTGHGGWPLSAFLTWEGKPFFGGTYFPPDRFLALAKHIVELWGAERGRVDARAAAIAEFLREEARKTAKGGALAPALLEKALRHFEEAHDAEHGGFGGGLRRAPKFPRTSVLDFLLRHAWRTGGESAARAERIVFNTLDHMLRGGIRDHLGGGFHRYSTDRRWLVPHFEKMLYDQALIARTLLDAYRASRRPAYLEAARETLDYVLGRLQSPDGGFYSAEDADTEGEEGKTYVWTRGELTELLGKERGEVLADYFGVTAEGNFEGGPASVLHLALDGGEEALAARLGRPLAEARSELARARALLLAARDKRPQPFLDDKVLVEWNGLAISALAHGYQVTGERRYLEAARRAAEFIVSRLVKDGRLLRRYRAGEAAIDGFLEDHAFLAEGLLDLYEAGFEPVWLERAVHLGKELLRLFWDLDGGGFFTSAEHHEKLIARQKEFYDGAVPSGNSVAFLVLLRLKELTTAKELEPPLEALEKLAGGLIAENPGSHPQLLAAAEYHLARPLAIVIAGASEAPATRAMVEEVERRFLPAKVVLHVESAEAAARLSALVPLVEGKLPLGGQPTAYVCRNQVCKLPARTLEALREQLEKAREEGHRR
jgi:uncharacterized protein YyaL (SSP411 family)